MNHTRPALGAASTEGKGMQSECANQTAGGGGQLLGSVRPERPSWALPPSPPLEFGFLGCNLPGSNPEFTSLGLSFPHLDNGPNHRRVYLRKSCGEMEICLDFLKPPEKMNPLPAHMQLVSPRTVPGVAVSGTPCR